eukprot:tig00021094_g18106.t1
MNPRGSPGQVWQPVQGVRTSTDPLSVPLAYQQGSSPLGTPRSAGAPPQPQLIPAAPPMDPLSSPGPPGMLTPSVPMPAPTARGPDPVDLFLMGASAGAPPTVISADAFFGSIAEAPPPPPPRRVKPTLDEVEMSLKGAKTLMYFGAWKAVLTMADRVEPSLSGAPLAERLKWRACKIVAQVRLRQYSAAAHELEQLGDLDGPQYAPSGSPPVSPVPWTLRMVHAEVPARTGNASLTIDRLFRLVDICRAAEEGQGEGSGGASSSRNLSDAFAGLGLGAGGGGGAGGGAARAAGAGAGAGEARRWRERELRALNALATHHKDYLTAVEILRGALARLSAPGAPGAGAAGPPPLLVAQLRSRIGRIQLQMGDIAAAESTFERVESETPDASSPIVHLNAGYLAMAAADYPAAASEFEQVLSVYPGHLAATSNRAISLLYSGRLADAIKVLEDALRRDPIRALRESIILNLCTMYDLAPGNSVEKKKVIQQLVLRYAPDDLDTAVLKLPPEEK